MKRRYLYFVFIILLVLTGCNKKYEEIEEINVLISNYETAMKEQNYEMADSYWCDVEDNSFSYYPQKIEDSEELYMKACEEIYAESFSVIISDVKINETSATANVTIGFFDLVRFVDDIPRLYDYDELTQRGYEGMKQEFLLDLSFYYKSKEGKATFVKVDGTWKIKSMEWQ